jgi:hypothetical protein
MINTLIGQQNFELIRDRIAEILSTEIAHQATLEGHDLWTENIFVWLERTAPFDKTELPCINVSLSSGEFDNYKATGDNDGNYQFDIDVYTKGVYTSTDNGDTKSTVLLHRILGVCKTILTNEQYKSLGFESKFIGNRNISSVQIADPNSMRRENETESIRLGRLVFKVRCNETNTTAVPIDLDSYATTVRLYNTAQGYFYSTNNTLPPTPPSCTVRATVINSNDTEITWKNVTDLDFLIEIPDVTIKVVNSEQTEINSEVVAGGINAEIEAPGVTITDGGDTFEQPAGTTYACSGGPTEINVRNENSTYSVNTDADLVLPNITANVIDSEGTIISSEELPSVEDLSLVAPNGTVTIINSENTTIGSKSVKSNGTENFELEDTQIVFKENGVEIGSVTFPTLEPNTTINIIM